jgi:hypothetical protein
MSNVSVYGCMQAAISAEAAAWQYDKKEEASEETDSKVKTTLLRDHGNAGDSSTHQKISSQLSLPW